MVKKTSQSIMKKTATLVKNNEFLYDAKGKKIKQYNKEAGGYVALNLKSSDDTCIVGWRCWYECIIWDGNNCLQRIRTCEPKYGPCP